MSPPASQRRFAVILATQRRRRLPLLRRQRGEHRLLIPVVKNLGRGSRRNALPAPVGQPSFSARLFILQPRMTAFDHRAARARYSH